MGVMGEYAAKLRAVADALETRVALDVCEAQALVFQAVERSVTPVRSGRLRDSETIDSLSGGGTHAEATVAPHTVYAQFRNDGGTITAKDEPARSGRTHASGKPYRHSLAFAGGGFAMKATQKGAGYVEKAQSRAPGPMRQAAGSVVDEIFGELA